MTISVNTISLQKREWIQLLEKLSNGTELGPYGTSGSWFTRKINSIEVDETGSASVNSFQFTLPAGTYECNIISSGPSGGARSRLKNLTDNVDVLYSTSTGVIPAIIGKFNITSSKTFEIQYRCSAGNSTVGFPTTAGVDEIYTNANFYRVSNITVNNLVCEE